MSFRHPALLIVLLVALPLLAACTSSGEGIGPLVNIVAPSNGDSFDPGETIALEFVVTDEDSDMEQLHYIVQDNDETVHEEGDMPASGRVTTSLSFADPGTFTLLVIVLDPELESGTDTVWVGVENP